MAAERIAASLEAGLIPSAGCEAAPMKLEPTKTGFAVNAADLARLFELPAEEVHRLMRKGGITSRFERGEGADAGRFRLTFFYPRRRVQLVVASDGDVLQHNRVSWPVPPAAHACRVNRPPHDHAWWVFHPPAVAGRGGDSPTLPSRP